jgi:hypothetical protein
MATFTELIAEVFRHDQVEIPAAIPGDWEPLAPDSIKPCLGPIWSHRVAEGFSDCLLFVDCDDTYSMNIVISRPRFNWQGHELQVSEGQEYQRIVVSAPPTDATIREVCNAVVEGIAETLRAWKTCKHCGGRQPSAYMQASGICMGCASSVLGIVY